MSKARRNPIGTPALQGEVLIRVGKGELVHVYDPRAKAALCRSGKNAGRKSEKKGAPDRRGKPQTLYRAHGAHFVTCYRCQKLVEMNGAAGRPPWEGA